MKIKRLLDYLFPPRCVFCSRVISPGKTVCGACEKEVVPVHWKQRMILPETGKTFLCTAPYSYDGKVRKAILNFKFRGKKKYGEFFSDRMLENIRRNVPDPSFSAVTCVPISRERQKKRGYNQSELLARRIAARAGLPYRPLLEKRVDNPEQHRLHRGERAQNVRGVYNARDPGAIRGGTVLLVDDIVTTGATLSECAGVLYRCGAKKVVCAVVAKVTTQSY